MVGRPGRPQSSVTSGELEPLMHERDELKYFASGLAYAENIEITPQGGFRNRDGLRDVGALAADAARIFGFDASNGVSYDLVFRPAEFEVWSATAKLDTDAIAGLTAAMLPEMTVAQQLDTMLVFHRSLQSKRIIHTGASSWTVDNVPFEALPLYDYGGVYTNGVAAVWTLEFIGVADSDGTGPDITGIFTLTVSGIETLSITYNTNMTTLAGLIQTAILDLPNTGTGITCTDGGNPAGTKVVITFGGADNVGDGWAVTGRVTNKPDAAIISQKTTAGVAPGEALFSAARGWPHCGTFNSQRLLVGGWTALPNAWIMSVLGDYYNFDKRLTAANGPALIPMDVAGGELLERIVNNRNLLFFTSKAEYWLAERTLASTTAPNHVKASTHGTKRGVPIVENEGAAIFTHANGGVIGEFRYTDVEGNFVAQDMSLLASHLVKNVVDQALRRATLSTDGNQLALVLGSGEARLATILREQEVTGFARFTSGAGAFKAVVCNGRNELGWIVQRGATRRLERSEDGLLLDEAQSFAFAPAQTAVTGLSRFDGRQIWAIGDGHVFGPFTVAGGAIALPIACSAVTVGTFCPPRIDTLPMPRNIAPNLVLKRAARIHSVKISVMDTTSIAISTNGKPLQEIDLRRYGQPADVAELNWGFTGEITVRGLTGYADEPYLTISQTRPGRLTVRSFTREAQL